MSQALLDFLRSLSTWLDFEEHRPECGFGTTVKSGPLEGNKIPCTCGLFELQSSLNRLIQ